MAGAHLDHDEHAAPGSRAVHGEQITRRHGRGPRAREPPPPGPGKPRRGRHAQPLQHPPRRARAPPDAKAGELAPDPRVTPARVLPATCPVSTSDPGAGRRPPRRGPAPRRRASRRCQRGSAPAPTSRLLRSALGEQPGQGSEHHPARPARPRPRVPPPQHPAPPAAPPATRHPPNAAAPASSTTHPVRQTNIRHSTRAATSPRPCQPTSHHARHTRAPATCIPLWNPTSSWLDRPGVRAAGAMLTVPLGDRRQQVVMVGLAPGASADHYLADAVPAVDEARVAGVGRVGDDGTAPVVVFQDRAGDFATLGPG